MEMCVFFVDFLVLLEENIVFIWEDFMVSDIFGDSLKIWWGIKCYLMVWRVSGLEGSNKMIIYMNKKVKGFFCRRYFMYIF